MTVEAGRDISVRKLEIGREKAPLLVIDNVVDRPDDLVRQAAARPAREAAAKRFTSTLRHPRMNGTKLSVIARNADSCGHSSAVGARIAGEATFMGVARAAGSYGSRFIVGDGRAIEANLVPFTLE